MDGAKTNIDGEAVQLGAGTDCPHEGVHCKVWSRKRQTCETGPEQREDTGQDGGGHSKTRRPLVKQMHDSKIKFPLPSRVQKSKGSLFKANRPTHTFCKFLFLIGF